MKALGPRLWCRADVANGRSSLSPEKCCSSETRSQISSTGTSCPMPLAMWTATLLGLAVSTTKAASRRWAGLQAATSARLPSPQRQGALAFAKANCLEGNRFHIGFAERQFGYCSVRFVRANHYLDMSRWASADRSKYTMNERSNAAKPPVRPYLASRGCAHSATSPCSEHDTRGGCHRPAADWLKTRNTT